jgi:hypothetical protein
MTADPAISLMKSETLLVQEAPKPHHLVFGQGKRGSIRETMGVHMKLDDLGELIYFSAAKKILVSTQREESNCTAMVYDEKDFPYLNSEPGLQSGVFMGQGIGPEGRQIGEWCGSEFNKMITSQKVTTGEQYLTLLKNLTSVLSQSLMQEKFNS